MSDSKTARENVQEFFRFYQEIERLEVQYKGRGYRLEDVCSRSSPQTPCKVLPAPTRTIILTCLPQLSSVLDLWDYNASVIMAADFDPLEKLNAGGLSRILR